jgi:transcriptional regulator with XRE-family HTH domain
MARSAAAVRESAGAHRVAPAMPAESEVLARALVRAGDMLGLTGEELATIVGLSPASISRIRHGRLVLDPASKPGELALMLLGAVRALDALVGARDELARAWLDAANADLGDVPRRMIRRVDGLARVARYLDAASGAR